MEVRKKGDDEVSLKGRNRAFYSYKNKDCSFNNYSYKNFDKADCYRTNFRGAIFDGASFRATKVKFCNMSEAHFDGTEFIRTNLRGTKFYNAIFTNVIINSVTTDKTCFVGAHFHHCIIVANLNKMAGINIDENDNIIMSQHKSVDISARLIKCAQDIIASSEVRNSVIANKGKQVNKITLLMLLYDFSEEELIQYLPKVIAESPKDCTVSYLRKQLKKIINSSNV